MSPKNIDLTSIGILDSLNSFILSSEVLYMPKKNISDREFLRSVGSNVLKIQFEAEKMPLDKRDQYIIDKLAEMEKNSSV